MAQFEDEASCHAYHLGLGKETFLLKGKDLMGYVTEQVKLWREAALARENAERAAVIARENAEREAAIARENAERELAREAAQAIIARENAERQAILDRENAERALAERAAVRAHELEMAKIKAANGEPGERGARVPEDAFRRSSQVVMPPFDPKTEDIDEYINQFERFATAQQLPPRYWVTNLLTLLPSTARGVCNSMTEIGRAHV